MSQGHMVPLLSQEVTVFLLGYEYELLWASVAQPPDKQRLAAMSTNVTQRRKAPVLRFMAVVSFLGTVSIKVAPVKGLRQAPLDNLQGSIT